MKGQDLLVLTQLLELGGDANLTYRTIGDFLGLSTSQVFESVERSFELGLLEKDRRAVRADRFTELLTYALPYLLPLKIGGPGSGLPLHVQPLAGVHQNQPGKRPERLVWQVEKAESPELGDGLVVSPLSRALVPFLQSRRDLVPFFSGIEILRMPEHPLRPLAEQVVKDEVLKLTVRGRQKQPSGSSKTNATTGYSTPLPDATLDIAIHYVARHGYKQTRFEDLEKVTGVSVAEFSARYEGREETLFRELLARATQAAGQFLGKLTLSSVPRPQDYQDAARSFLAFLDTHEDFYRLIMWGYLESDIDFLKEQDANYKGFLDLLALKIATTIEGLTEREKYFRAYLFVSCPQWFAILRWCETRRINNEKLSAPLKEDVKRFLIEDVLGRVVAPT